MNKHNLIAELESLKAEWGKSFTAEGIQMSLDIVKKYQDETIKMNLETILRLISNYEPILIIEGDLAFVDKHIYQGLNAYFYEYCKENNIKDLRNRTVTKLEVGVNLIYIFIEKEKAQ